MTLQIRPALRRAGKALRPARGRHARPSLTRAGVRKAVRVTQTVLALGVTGIVCVLLGAVLSLQGPSSPTASTPDRSVLVEQAPEPPPPAPAQTGPRPRPAAPKEVVLRPGDTLFALAERYETTVKELQRFNGLGQSTLIYAGDVLHLTPTAAASGAASPKRSEPAPVKRPSPGRPGKDTSRKDSSGRKTSPRSQEPDAKGRAAAAVAFAKAQTAKPYIWGATGPNGYDCSGLVMRSWKAAGVNIPRTTWQQIHAGNATTRRRLAPGDLVVSHGGGHVALYIGDGKVIHAPGRGSTVTVAPLPPASRVVGYRHIAA
ncbi:NlpC/P60 family protein [Streptomyces sp. NPDC000351]|uniref:C40 family peptidase n=1 Tax=Streptomyces sp. NPDC000351 TaxID=3154250 RepID=UPI00331F6610